MEPMSSHTTFRIGGPAEAYVCPGNEEELGKVICLCREHDIPWSVLGNGSNLLVSDRGIKGVVIAMEPDTGKILAMVSKPGYDPNSLPEDWEALTARDNKEGQLLNRATQGLYPPGSTFKIVTALEYMREHPADYKNYQFDCGGVYENGEYRIKCYHSTANAPLQELAKARVKS